MSDDTEPPFDAGKEHPDEQPPHAEHVGSVGSVGTVGEEAAKLFAALGELAKDKGSVLGSDLGADLGASAASTAAHVSDALKDVSAHVGHGEDCRYCPVCQAIRVVRETSPEVKAHLAVAASSLMQAAAGVLATHVPDDKKGPSVEHIDLADNDDDWGDDG
ncbi:MAG TPA: hypothetical protein VFO98_08850 [Marmoricola sp.]|nr:hypothetical protein [Marmoricola sp.]